MKFKPGPLLLVLCSLFALTRTQQEVDLLVTPEQIVQDLPSDKPHRDQGLPQFGPVLP